MRRLFLLFAILFTCSIGYSQTKHVLLEEVTGTWCQWCTGGTYYADSLKASNSKFITIAVHGNDLMENTNYYSATGLSSFPSANIDRENQGASIGSWFSAANNALNTAANADVEVFTHFNPATRQLTARIKATFANAVGANYKLGGIIVEDGITGPAPQYDQSNKYGGGSNGPMGGFEQLPSSIPATMIAYNHVGRELLGGYSGQLNSVPSSVSAGDTASVTFTHTLPVEWDEKYIRVVGVLYKPTGEVDNCNESHYLDGNSNAKPVFISPAKTTAAVSAPYVFDVYANDADNKTLSITAPTLPAWLSLSATQNLGFIHNKATLTGTPTATGTFPVKLVVSDGARADTLNFTITVSPAAAGNWQLVGAQDFADSDFLMGLVVDKNGTAYAMIEANGNSNVYQKTTNGTWTNYGNLNGIGYHGTIKLGSDQLTPWVVVSDGNSVVVKKYDNGSWVQQGSFPTSGVQIGFDIDANDKPYVALQDGGASYTGNCYTYDGNSWSKVGGMAYSGSLPGVWNDLKIDKATGHVYVLWNGFSNGQQATVSKWDGSSWSDLGNSTISTASVMFSQSLVLGPNATPYVAFARSNSGADALDVVKFNGSNWVNIGSDISNGAVEDVSLCINSLGRLIVAYKDITNGGGISAQTYDGNAWSLLGTSGFSLVAASSTYITSYQNMPYVMYKDDAANKATLRYYDFPVAIPESPVVNTKLDIFPNPATHFVVIQGLPKDLQYNIYNINGQLIESKTSEEQIRINVQQYKAGVYFIQCHEYTGKFIVK